MSMNVLFVIDTNCLIAYYKNVFNASCLISRRCKNIIDTALSPFPKDIKISIPSVVFIEIFEKWLKIEELSRKFYYEVFVPITNSPNIEIRQIDCEVLESLQIIRGRLEGHDLHDKLVLASAYVLKSRLMTTDSEVIKFINETKIIPGVIN